MKIALLTDAIFPNVIGGIQKHSFLLLKHLANQNCSVDVYHSQINHKLDIKQYFTPEELKRINLIDFLYPNSIKIPGHYIYTSYKLSRLYYNRLKKEPYDLIYAQGFTGWDSLIKEPFKSNFITNLHGLEMFQHSSNIREYVGKQMLRIPAKYIIKKSKNQISLGGKLTDILKIQNAPKNSIAVLPNAIEQAWLTEKFKERKNARLKFVFIGRYERTKGIEELSEVLKELKVTENFEFYFIGPIPEAKKIYHKKITYYGQVNNENLVRSILLDCDVLVCPSHSEGMPTVVLEAMASGCAIIASDVGAVSELVSEKNGFLIQPKNKQELKDKITKCIDMTTNELEQLKKASREMVKENYLWENVIRKHLDLFHRIIKES